MVIIIVIIITIIIIYDIYYMIILLINDIYTYIYIHIQEPKELSNECGGTFCFIGYELSIVEQDWDQ
jgi:hypothetical protein